MFIWTTSVWKSSNKRFSFIHISRPPLPGKDAAVLHDIKAEIKEDLFGKHRGGQVPVAGVGQKRQDGLALVFGPAGRLYGRVQRGA